MLTTVAIVEDHPEFMRLFSDAVAQEHDFELSGTAANGGEAFALINRQRADVYLVDLGLPDMNGIDVIRHALRTHPGCEVMVITIFGDEEHVISSVEAGATGYILKESAPPEIVAAIRLLCSGGSPVTPSIARKILRKFHADKSVVGNSGTASIVSAGAEAALTDREAEILRVLAKGLSFNEIGESLSISAHTVARHVKHIYRKLAVHSRGEAVYEATRIGLLDL